MSVLLDGAVEAGQTSIYEFDNSDKLNWSGVWQFTKEHKSDLNFRYNWVSESIPRDLVDYVSFTHRTYYKKPGKPKTSKSSKETISSLALNSEASTAFSVNVSSELIIASDQDGEEIHYGQQINLEPVYLTTSVDKQNSFVSQPGCTSGDSISNPIESSEVEKESESVKVDRYHPILGLWQGSFDVKHGEGLSHAMLSTNSTFASHLINLKIELIYRRFTYSRNVLFAFIYWL